MKKILFITLALLIKINAIYAQDNCGQNCDTSDSINISTGVDAIGNVLGFGLPDPNWLLINNPPLRNVGCDPGSTPAGLQALISIPNAYTMNYTNGGNVAMGPNQWVNQLGSITLAPGNIHSNASGSFANGGGFGCNNFNNQPYIFERGFCVCQDDTVSVNVSIAGDDQVILQLLDDNNTIIANSNVYNYATAPAPVNWNFNRFLVRGRYRIRALLVNTGNTTIGFSVVGNVTSNNNSLKSNITDCCNFYTLSIQKILDQNCNGVFENGIDQIGGSGWNFQVLNSSNIPVRNGTTNNFGEIIFSGLSTGTYTIVESPNNSSSFSTPFQNNIQIQLSPNNPVENIQFFNCPPPPCCPEEKTFEFNLTKLGGPHNYNPGAGWSGNKPLSFVENKITISNPNGVNIPVTQVRLSIVDMHFEDNIEACGDCIDNSANWASLSHEGIPGTDDGKPIVSGLSGQLDATTKIYDGSNQPAATWYTFNKNYNAKELVWENPNGVILTGGEELEFETFLPPFSEIPCCTKKVKICYKVTYKFADCTECDEIICSAGYDLSGDPSKKKN